MDMDYIIISTTVVTLLGVIIGMVWHFANRNRFSVGSKIHLSVFYAIYLIAAIQLSLELNYLIIVISVLSVLAGYGMSCLLLRREFVEQVLRRDREKQLESGNPIQ